MSREECPDSFLPAVCPPKVHPTEPDDSLLSGKSVVDCWISKEELSSAVLVNFDCSLQVDYDQPSTASNAREMTESLGKVVIRDCGACKSGVHDLL